MLNIILDYKKHYQKRENIYNYFILEINNRKKIQKCWNGFVRKHYAKKNYHKICEGQQSPIFPKIFNSRSNSSEIYNNQLLLVKITTGFQPCNLRKGNEIPSEFEILETFNIHSEETFKTSFHRKRMNLTNLIGYISYNTIYFAHKGCYLLFKSQNGYNYAKCKNTLDLGRLIDVLKDMIIYIGELPKEESHVACEQCGIQKYRLTRKYSY